MIDIAKIHTWEKAFFNRLSCLIIIGLDRIGKYLFIHCTHYVPV